MARWDPASPTSLPAIQRYGIAILSVVTALGLALLQRGFDLEVALFLMVIAVTVWYARMGPGIVAIVLSIVSLDYFFVPPIHHLEVGLVHLPQFVVFTLFALVISWLSASRRRAEQWLRQARSELESKVAERTAQLTRTTGEAVAAQQRFRDLVNSVEGIVWEADASSFQFSFVSQQAERILGYPLERWLSEPSFWKDSLHPDDRAWAVDFCIQATADKRNHEFEYRMVAADGRIVWIRDLVTVVVEEDRATRLRGVMLDVTKRKQAEAALREQANLLKLTHDAIFVRDMDSVITFWNRGSEELYGWKAEEAVARVAHQLLHTIFPVPLEQIEAELLHSGRWEGELVHTKADGSRVVAASRWSLQTDEQNRPMAILETNNDITERKRAEESLRQAQADLEHVSRLTTMGELTASLAHEVNQPIAAAVTNANTCLRWLAGDHPNVEEGREAAMRIVKDGTRAAEIISRVRLLYKKGTPQRELVDVNDVIQEMAVLLRGEARRYSVSLRTDLAPDLPPVMADRVQLQQVLMNIMMNGIEAMKDGDGGGELVIRSQRSDDEQLLISVSDTGLGLPEAADQIFNAFFTTKPDGTGMGLPISRSIIESHGGRLWATANSSRGATFHLTLPAKAEG